MKFVIIGFVIIILYLIYLYNSLVKLRVRVKNAWSQIDVQLKRRHDLIPNLVETVKGYAKHEKELFESIAKYRAMAENARTMKEIGDSEGRLTEAVGKLIAVVENYPELKANENFLQLQEELVSTENKIAFARQFYNDMVMKYNTKIESFPSNIVANMFHFKKAEFLLFPGERQNVAVEF